MVLKGSNKYKGYRKWLKGTKALKSNTFQSTELDAVVSYRIFIPTSTLEIKLVELATDVVFTGDRSMRI